MTTITASQRTALLKVVESRFTILEGEINLAMDRRLEDAEAEIRARYRQALDEYDLRAAEVVLEIEPLKLKIASLVAWAAKSGLSPVYDYHRNDNLDWHAPEMQPAELNELRRSLKTRNEHEARAAILALRSRKAMLTEQILLAEVPSEAKTFLDEIPTLAQLLPQLTEGKNESTV